LRDDAICSSSAAPILASSSLTIGSCASPSEVGVGPAFEAYATGDYTLTQLADELRVRGLTHRPTAQRAARPVTFNKLHQILRNRYYLGLVTWRGVEYEGKHPALVDAATFEAVQAVLSAHRLAGERSHKHHFSQTTSFSPAAGSTGREGYSRIFHQLAGLSAVVTRQATPPTARGGCDRFRLPR
jgi:hypothetical protein